MKVFAAYEAESRFSELLRAASNGEVFVITRDGERMAELRPCASVQPQRKRGMLRDQMAPVPSDFNEPLQVFDGYQ